MRLAFMGSPDFAVPALEALLTAGHEIAMVYTQPPRPAGRGRRPRPSRVGEVAVARGLALATPARLKGNPDEWARFAALGLDRAVIAAYGLILPPEILSAPRLGCLNIHASLLPRWRGASPVAAAILAGDAETGITIIEMDQGLDTGAILLQKAVPIPPDATQGSLAAALGELGARLIVDALAERSAARPQPAAGVTYAPKLARDDGLLDWRAPAVALARQVRAYDPWPGSFCAVGPTRLKVFKAEVASQVGPAGTLLDPQFTVACGVASLRLLEVQPAGRPRMPGAAFLRGQHLTPGSRLD